MAQLESMTYQEQLAWLQAMVEDTQMPRRRRMLLSLAESVKQARDHQDCLKEQGMRKDG